MRRIRERMSIGNITSPSPGPPASRTRPLGSPSPQGEGFLAEILRGENEKAKAAALLPYRGIGVLEWAGLCFHQHSRFVRWFFQPARCRGRVCPALVRTGGNAGTASRPPTAGWLLTDRAEHLRLRPQPTMYYYNQVYSRRAKMLRLRTRTDRSSRNVKSGCWLGSSAQEGDFSL